MENPKGTHFYYFLVFWAYVLWDYALWPMELKLLIISVSHHIGFAIVQKVL